MIFAIVAKNRGPSPVVVFVFAKVMRVAFSDGR